MRPLESHEPMMTATPSLLAKNFGTIQFVILELGKMDLRFEGTFKGGKCVWLKDGRRVEFELIPGGSYIASTSKKPDPEWPGRKDAKVS